MTLLVADVEVRRALARPRLFFMNVAVPLLLVIPIAVGGAPRFHASAVYTVLFVLAGTFGSAIPLVRDAETGLLDRLLRTRLSSAGYLLQRAAAGGGVDSVQLTPALLVAALGAGATPTQLAAVWVALVASLWLTNLLGVAAAAGARSLAETALFSAVTSLLLLHASGVFRTPLAGSLGATAEAVSPFRTLHETISAMGTASPVAGTPTLVAWSLALPLLTALLAPVLTRMLRPLRRA